MDHKLLVVDDFFEKPDDVRRMALRAEYTKDRHTPNLTSNRKFASPELYQKFSELLATPVVDSGLDFSGKFRITYGGTPRERDIHIDHPDWNLILYLNPPEQCQGGTSIWRHRKTQWEEIPSLDQAKAAGFENSDQAVYEILAQDGTDRTKWEETLRIPMKFNRLVVLRSTFFHSSFDDFGSTPEDARLVQTFFLNRAG